MRWLASISLALLLTASAGYALPSAPSVAAGGCITIRWTPEAAAVRGTQLRRAQLEPMAAKAVAPPVASTPIVVAVDPAPRVVIVLARFQRPPPSSGLPL